MSSELKKGGGNSTDEAFALQTKRLRVRFSAFPRNFSLLNVVTRFIVMNVLGVNYTQLIQCTVQGKKLNSRSNPFSTSWWPAGTATKYLSHGALMFKI